MKVVRVPGVAWEDLRVRGVTIYGDEVLSDKPGSGGKEAGRQVSNYERFSPGMAFRLGIKPRWQFFPTVDGAYEAQTNAHRHGLAWERLDVKKAVRAAWQKRADMGEVRSPTRWELWIRGVDTAEWDEYGNGKGVFRISSGVIKNIRDHPDFRWHPEWKVLVHIDGTVWVNGGRYIDQGSKDLPRSAYIIDVPDTPGVPKGPVVTSTVEGYIDPETVVFRSVQRPKKGRGRKVVNDTGTSPPGARTHILDNDIDITETVDDMTKMRVKRHRSVNDVDVSIDDSVEDNVRIEKDGLIPGFKKKEGVLNLAQGAKAAIMNKGNIKTLVSKTGDKPPWKGNHWHGEHWDPAIHGGIGGFGPAGDPKTTRIDYYAWYREFIEIPEYPLGKCHEEWGYRLERAEKVIFKCPRDSLKTYFLDIGYMAYLILEKSDMLATRGILNIAWDKDIAGETLMAVKNVLQENPKILEFYGSVIDENRPLTAQKMFFVYQPSSSKNPGLFCAALKMGRITGTHPIFVFIDDPQDEPMEEKMMKRFRIIYNKKIVPAVGTGGRIIVTGTTKGWNVNNDVYLWLESKKVFQVYVYEAVVKSPNNCRMPPWSDVIYEEGAAPAKNFDGSPRISVTGEALMERVFRIKSIKNEDKYILLWPEHYTLRDLVLKRLEILDSGTKSDDDFWSEYFLQARNPAGGFFKTARITYNLPNDLYRPVTSWLDLAEYCANYHHPVVAWIDPGGETSHGIAISVMACIKIGLHPRYIIFDMIRVRGGIPAAAKKLGHLITRWGVVRWGCEGNFMQKEAYGHTIERELYAFLHGEGRDKDYSPAVIKNNTGDKIQRISSRFSSMLGLDSDLMRVFVNPEAEAIDDFNDEIHGFGQAGSTERHKKHDFDIIDSIVSNEIHMLGISRPFAIVAI